jgi:ABC-type histidine transport system ATPase subunit
MASVQIRAARKSYGAAEILKGVSVDSAMHGRGDAAAQGRRDYLSCLVSCPIAASGAYSREIA